MIKAHYVAGIIRSILSSGLNIVGSATIGDPGVFRYETGIEGAFRSFPSEFPVENTRVFLPTDTPNLAYNQRDPKTKRVWRRDSSEPNRILRRIARVCNEFAEQGIRCLVLVVSERERLCFLDACEDLGVEVITYDENISARQAAERFRNGEGQVLVGTSANYNEGVDLPGKVAEVTFILRPAYPPPHDPGTIFEERRFGSMRWKVWMWREMIRALQGRGRNVRNKDDKGVTFFISQQFRRYLFGSLPEWLQGAYRGNKTFDECIEETLEMLKR